MPLITTAHRSPGTHFARYLSSDGTTSGTKNAAVNFGAETDYWLAGVAGQRWDVGRLIITIEDAAIRGDHYGGLGSALANGISVIVTDGTSEVDVMDGVPVTKTVDWSRYMFDGQLLDFGGASTETWVARLSFSKFNGGEPISLFSAAHKLIVRFGADDLSGLVSHYFLAEGVTYYR